METLEAIKRRRSIRKFQKQALSPQHIDSLLEAAMCAPSAGNAQEAHFILINDPTLLQNIPEIHPYAGMSSSAPIAILVCADTRKEVYPGNFPADCAAAVENILLAATDLGLGAVWVGIYPNEIHVNAFRKLFELSEFLVPFALIPVGHPAESRQSIQRYDKQKVHINHW